MSVLSRTTQAKILQCDNMAIDCSAIASIGFILQPSLAAKFAFACSVYHADACSCANEGVKESEFNPEAVKNFINCFCGKVPAIEKVLAVGLGKNPFNISFEHFSDSFGARAKYCQAWQQMGSTSSIEKVAGVATLLPMCPPHIKMAAGGLGVVKAAVGVIKNLFGGGSNDEAPKGPPALLPEETPEDSRSRLMLLKFIIENGTPEQQKLRQIAQNKLDIEARDIYEQKIKDDKKLKEDQKLAQMQKEAEEKKLKEEQKMKQNLEAIADMRAEYPQKAAEFDKTFPKKADEYAAACATYSVAKSTVKPRTPRANPKKLSKGQRKEKRKAEEYASQHPQNVDEIFIKGNK